MSAQDKLQEIRDRIKVCMKKANSFEVRILRTVLGELQNIDMVGIGITEDEIDKVFRKFRQGVQETVDLLQKQDAEGDMSEYKAEISIYDKYIQETLSVEEIVKQMDVDLKSKIQEAKSDGQATGIAMGFFKKNGANILGKDVSNAVKKVRKNNER